MKQFGYLLLLCFFILQACKNQTKKIPNHEQTRSIAADSIPKPIGFVNDFEQLFSIEEIHVLDSIINAHENKTTNQICIVTIDSSFVSATNFNQFIYQLHNTWGVGSKKNNNGIVIGISRQLRIVRINLGYGIEPLLTNEHCDSIIQTIFIPSFKQNHFYEGTLNGLQYIIHQLEQK
jgi:uncharacterized protein